MSRTRIYIAALLLTTLPAASVAAAETYPLTITVTDADTGDSLPCRVYVQDPSGQWLFARSTSPQGSAIAYARQNRGKSNSVEMHTTCSAHPFVVDVPPGRCTVTVERGKEYLTATRTITVGDKPATLDISLERWVNMAQLGYYSGDTHVHRSIEELPNVQLAEDLNVSFPLLYWVTRAYEPPGTGDKSTEVDTPAKLIKIDDTHVIYPRNTEYEIFSVNGRRFTLGAVFILNHESVFDKGVPPVGPIADKARAEGALLELDKHNWQWSMMLVPVMNVDLFELSNNHIWRTEFAFTDFGLKPPAYMNIETNDKGFTERGWIEYGMQNYYALLNCGFRMRPTAGTASGVHPVPLGFGRVYVRLEGGFDYDRWVKGLDAGNSFVTTGPMILMTINGCDPGSVIDQPTRTATAYRIAGEVRSAAAPASIEIMVNGRLHAAVRPQNRRTDSRAFVSHIDTTLSIDSSSWIAIRCFENAVNGKVRFAHSSPVHIGVPDRPLRPRKAETDFLINRIKQQIKLNTGLLNDDALAEYRKALKVYEKIAETAVDID